MRCGYKRDFPIEFRPVESISPLITAKRPPYHHVWIRTKGAIPDDKILHRYVLLYASDFNLLTTALMPHEISPYSKDLIIASLDHAIWFHRDFRIDDWLLYAIDSPSASNARGFSRGNIFTRDGTLVASVIQEGLLRVRK
jgi:acyl-CoA thioesterase-2